MSEKVALTVSCDVCGRPFWTNDGDSDRRGRPKKVKMSVWFDTETNEGKPVEPYLSYVEIDMCPECAKAGIRVWASGCMGFNEYRIAGETGGASIVGSTTDGLTTERPTKRYELSCGHSVTLDGFEKPSFCPTCGDAVRA